MAVIHDYFRAADTPRAALAAMDLPAGPQGSEGSFDGIRAQGVDPYDVLGQLIALIRRVPTWAPNLVQAIDVSPALARRTREARNRLYCWTCL